MARSRLRRTGALVLSAALLASLTMASVAGPAAAAKPRCQGLPATIVGTARGERLVGTAGRDVIVAKGGHDRIYGKGGNDVVCGGGGNDTVVGGPGADRLWGQTGHDRLLGGPGPDFLAGQIGNDTLNGGIGVDTCFQGTGAGAVIACERPAPPAPAPPPPTAPKVLVIAYSDLNANHTFDTGDVLISRIDDSNGDDKVSAGDTIVMGRYPKNLNPGSGDFADWDVKSHVVATVSSAIAKQVILQDSAGGQHRWIPSSPGDSDYYWEGTSQNSFFVDSSLGFTDFAVTSALSPSKPSVTINLQQAASSTDDRFIDVDFFFTP